MFLYSLFYGHTMQLNPICKQYAETLGILLIKKNYFIATAESCTGGLIGATLTTIPGSSTWFKGGIIAYSNDIKESQLSVPASILEKYGAVSEETVAIMAKQSAQKFNTQCSIAVSGIAGPDGGTQEKPIGLVCIGIHCVSKTHTHKEIFKGNRDSVREQTVLGTIKLLCSYLTNA